MLKFNLKFNCMRIIIFPAAASIWFAWKFNKKKVAILKCFMMTGIFWQLVCQEINQLIRNEVKCLKWIRYTETFLEQEKTPKVQRTQVTTKLKHPGSPKLLSRIKGQHFDSGGSNVEAEVEGEVESSVLYYNLKKTSLHPQLTKSSTTTMTFHHLTSPPTCQFCSQRAEQL